MKIQDIARVEVDWAEKYANDPSLKIILKRDRTISPWGNFRFRQKDRMFFAEFEGEVSFLYHNPGDHNGFGFRKFALRMEDGYDPAQAGWHDCDVKDRDHGCMMNRPVRCYYDAPTNTIHLTGPWSSNSTAMVQAFGVESMNVSILDGPSRETVRNPAQFERNRRRGWNYEGTFWSAHLTVDFAREVVDTLVPHLELYQGDCGWTVKRRDMPPKNPRRHEKPAMWSAEMSGEQNAVLSL
jgi:hypothetical protein